MMPSLRRVRFRRSPFLVSYWQGHRLLIENFASRVRVEADPLACRILHFFDRWRPAAALEKRLSDYSAASLRRALGLLVKHTLLERSDRPRPVTAQQMESWAKWNPAAGFFHFSTKDLTYVANPLPEGPPPGKNRRMRRLVTHKRYPDARQFALPPSPTKGEFPATLLARRTWRRFASDQLDLTALGGLLGLTFRVQKWLAVSGGRVPLKTSPSGGARHPVEAYVLALRVKGLPRGLYHYAADVHRLERLRRGASPREVTRFLPGQWWYRSAAALVLLTGVFPREQARYNSARAYRTVLLDAGHLSQTFCLTATWLGLAPFCTLALADSVVEKALGVDGVTESVLYAVGVGVRPEGVEAATWPQKPPRRRSAS